jgi:hypothetical protein
MHTGSMTFARTYPERRAAPTLDDSRLQALDLKTQFKGENEMHRFTRVRTRTITVLAIVLAAVAAYAAINYKSGPTFSISSFNLITTGELSGLGGAAHVAVDAVGTASGTCTNKGGTTVPVHAATVDASGTATARPDANGRANFSVTASPVANPNPCPNGNWTFDITSVTYTSATISISTGGSQSRVDSFALTNCSQSDPNVVVSCTATPQ